MSHADSDDNDTASGLPGPLRTALETFAQRPRILLGADFDGTLAPFVVNAMQARSAPGALARLYAAASLPGVTVAVVSGRDLSTLRALTGIPRASPIVLIGSHGGESSLQDPGTAGVIDAAASARLAAARADLGDVATAYPGTRIELKPGAVSIHTRGVDPAVGAAALAAALEVSTRHTGVHVIPGKEVVELTVLETDKGVALRDLGAARAVVATAYFGDDVTDEDAFAALDPGSGDVTVKVGEGQTLAAHRIASVSQVVAALGVVVSTRQNASGD
jgi:trehalose 6-phosphate phosphatase